MTTTDGSSKPTMVVVTAIYSVLLALLNICILGLPVIGLGALIGGVGSKAAQQANSSAEAVTVQTASALGGGLITVFGIVFLVIGIALLVNAVGLFQGRPWAWMLTMVLYGVYVVLVVLGWIINNSFNVLSLVLVIISATIVYFFYTNADIKRALGKV